jgi:hypothetical protein
LGQETWAHTKPEGGPEPKVSNATLLVQWPKITKRKKVGETTTKPTSTVGVELIIPPETCRWRHTVQSMHLIRRPIS